jgi:actin-related protein|tara:strand:- start:401 stop:598 length:198 start_codon:yes stop_codon:yes gene_type:complete
MQKLVVAIKKIAVEMILNDETKEKVIKQLNKKINLPMISEETEAELLDALYESIQEALKDVIEKK